MRAWLACAALLLSACSPVYVYQAWRGQSRILSARRPIQRVLEDPSTTPAIKEKLRLVLDVRRYAFETVGIPETDNYSDYAAVDGPAVSWVVSASKRTRLEPKTWWFPFVGRVPYKGYFDRRDAQAELDSLERRDWDATFGGVSAYSTLRWFRDPVLSTMLEQPTGEQAELLLHELTHTTVFLKGQVDFNEALATFVGETAAERFLKARFGEGSREFADYRRGVAEQELRAKAVDELFGELDALYGGAGTEVDKLKLREAVFERYQARLRTKTLNNAVVLAQRRYRFDLSDFRRAFEKAGGNWRKFLEEMRALDRLRPREDLKRRLML